MWTTGGFRKGERGAKERVYVIVYGKARVRVEEVNDHNRHVDVVPR